MGVGTALNGGETGSSVSIDGGNGLADVWIVGEPFFRDVQVAFNVSLQIFTLEYVPDKTWQWKEKKVGMQRA